MLDIGNVSAPGAGRALGELAFGPIGVGLALVGVFELLKGKIDDASEAAEKFTEITSNPETGGIEAITSAWEDATKAHAAYEASLATAGQDQDPVGTKVKRLKEIGEAAGSPTAELDALTLELQMRTAQGGVLAQREATTNQAKQDADAKYDTDEGKLKYAKNVVTNKDSKEYQDMQGRQESASAALESAKQLPDTIVGGGSIPQVMDNTTQKAAAIADAQSKVDAVNKELENYRSLISQLEGTETDRQKTKDEADEAAKKAAIESLKNQSRRVELPGEIQQAQTVQAAKLLKQDVAESRKDPMAPINANLEKYIESSGLTHQQTVDLMSRLVAGQITIQQALSVLGQRLNTLHGQMGQTDYHTR